MKKFEAVGFPGFLGPVVGIAEVVASFFLLIGFFSRIASFTFIVIIGVAIVWVQFPAAMAAGELLTTGLERDLLILGAMFVILTQGPGILAVKQ